MKFDLRFLCQALGWAVLFLCQACGGGAELAPHLQDCVKPPNSFELCYETRSHTRTLGDVLRGSPGLSMRLYGRTQGYDVPLRFVSGGPELPDEWIEQNGDADCYALGVDFEAAIAAIEAKDTPNGLQNQRTFVVRVTKDFKELHHLEPEELRRCEGITPDNMHDKHINTKYPSSVPPHHSRQSARHGATGHLTGQFLPASSRPLFTPLVHACFPKANEQHDVCLEAVRDLQDPRNALRLRIVSGPEADVTMLIHPTSGDIPESWTCPSDSYTAVVDATDWRTLATEILLRADENPRSAEVMKIFHGMAESMAQASEQREKDIKQAQTSSNEVNGRGQQSTAQVFGSASDWRNRGRKGKLGNSEHLYRSKLEVYAKKAFFGLAIHSGTTTRVEVYTDAGWRYEFEDLSCNHGDCPLYDTSMKHRFTCAPAINTWGWYAFDGECSDHWPSHTCNDDTALQINNVFGRWSEDRCQNIGRKHAPRCEIQW